MSHFTDVPTAMQTVVSESTDSAARLSVRIEQYLHTRRTHGATTDHWGHVGDVQRLNARLQELHELMDRLGV
jgi:hypothetical protein